MNFGHCDNIQVKPKLNQFSKHSVFCVSPGSLVKHSNSNVAVPDVYNIQNCFKLICLLIKRLKTDSRQAGRQAFIWLSSKYQWCNYLFGYYYICPAFYLRKFINIKLWTTHAKSEFLNNILPLYIVANILSGILIWLCFCLQE